MPPFTLGLAQKVDKILKKDLLLEGVLRGSGCPLFVKNLSGNVSYTTLGWIFLRNPLNKFPVNGDTWLRQNINGNARPERSFFGRMAPRG